MKWHTVHAHVYVVVNFLSQVILFLFSFVSTSLTLYTLPYPKKRKTKITWDKNLSTIYNYYLCPVYCLGKRNDDDSLIYLTFKPKH